MILMLTAAGSPHERVAGLASGADDYLPKPFHFPELVLRVRALARRKPTAQTRTLRAAGIELDPLTRTANREGRQLDLSTKEFAGARGAPQSQSGSRQRRTTAPTSLGRERRPVHQTVKTTISRLRHKLRDPQIIQTIPGVGYRLSITAQDRTVDPRAG